MLAKRYATLYESLFQLLQTLQKVVGYRLVGQVPQSFCWLQLGRVGRQKLKVYPFRNLDLLARVSPGLIQDQKEAPLF